MYATSVAVSVDEVPNSAFPPRVYNYAVSIAIPPTDSAPPSPLGHQHRMKGKGGWKMMIRMTRDSARDTDHLSPRQSHPFSSKFNVRRVICHHPTYWDRRTILTRSSPTVICRPYAALYSARLPIAPTLPTADREEFATLSLKRRDGQSRTSSGEVKLKEEERRRRADQRLKLRQERRRCRSFSCRCRGDGGTTMKSGRQRRTPCTIIGTRGGRFKPPTAISFTWIINTTPKRPRQRRQRHHRQEEEEGEAGARSCYCTVSNRIPIPP